MNRRIQERLYDPDIVSILMVVLSAFGAIGGIAGTLAYIDNQREKREQCLHEARVQERIEGELKIAFFEISRSVTSIQNDINALMKLVDPSLNNETDISYTHLSMMFGRGPLLLNGYEFYKYRVIQNSIIAEISKFLRNVSIIEEILSQNGKQFSERLHFEKIKYDIHKIIEIANKLMFHFKEISIKDFSEELMNICNQIRHIAHWFDRPLNRN